MCNPLKNLRWQIHHASHRNLDFHSHVWHTHDFQKTNSFPGWMLVERKIDLNIDYKLMNHEGIEIIEWHFVICCFRIDQNTLLTWKIHKKLFYFVCDTYLSYQLVRYNIDHAVGFWCCTKLRKVAGVDDIEVHSRICLMADALWSIFTESIDWENWA
jgi:hypothetical protein